MNYAFQWDDETVKELLSYIHDDPFIGQLINGKACLEDSSIAPRDHILKQFKKSKEDIITPAEILEFYNETGKDPWRTDLIWEWKKSKEPKKETHYFNEQKLNKRIDELVAMEKGFNIAKEGKYDTFLAWQKGQKKKDYEILSFRTNYYHILSILPKKSNGAFGGLDIAEEALLASGLYDINAVKRLSDGEIFTNGDDTNHGVIKEFIISDFELYAQCERGQFNINEIKGVPKVLFKTEDGKEIFNDDSYYAVERDYSIGDGIGGDDYHRTNRVLTTFSTREAAEEYILMNKPLLSLKDINNIGKLTDYRIELNRKELKALAKYRVWNQTK